MTSPIAFTKMPFPKLPADADLVDAFSDNAETAAVNFALINPYFQTHKTRIATAIAKQLVTVSSFSPRDGLWHPFTSAQWSTATLTLPATTTALLVSVSAEIDTESDGTTLYVGYSLTGAGIPAGIFMDRAALGAAGTRLYGAKTTVFLPVRDGLVAGKPVTAAVSWLVIGSTGGWVTRGQVQLLALYGGP